jgi:hypothetical protein
VPPFFVSGSLSGGLAGGRLDLDEREGGDGGSSVPCLGKRKGPPHVR